jgi:plastocyanin
MSRTYRQITSRVVPVLLTSLGLVPAVPGKAQGRASSPVSATLSEWKIELSSSSVSAGDVTFSISNAGSIPHAFEVEGQGIERETALVQPGASTTLTLALQPGTYEVYCPVGEDSHKKLGMETHLQVVGAARPASPRYDSAEIGRKANPTPKVQGIQVSGEGPVIQILPGPFPFADSLGSVLPAFGEERAMLESQARNGPYSNNVAPISGRFSFSAWDKGATRDSIQGVADFTTTDHARWRLVLDRVQTKDVPHHPRFGGVIMGLYYHGITTVHTPLVPTINSAVALWAFGHLYRNGALVTDDAPVHVMLLSRTRRDGDYALSCWDCSKNKIEEVQLQVTPVPGQAKYDAPGGFLFLNWERSDSRKLEG